MDAAAFFRNLGKRLREAEKNSESFQKNDAEHAGRVAEYVVCRELSERMSGTGWELRDNIRVPDPASRRRREIDFVITAPDRAIVVELKNWTGEVLLSEDGHVIQKRRYGKEPIDHGPLFDDLRDRVETLRLHHATFKRETVRIDAFVVFYDERGNLTLDISMTSRPDVVAFEKLLKGMPSQATEQSLLKRVLLGLMAIFGFEQAESGATKAKPSNAIAALRETLADLGSWDILALNGGRVLFGDILPETGNSLPVLKSGLFDRRKTVAVSLEVDRSRLLALFREPDEYAVAKTEGADGSVKDWRIKTDTAIFFHPAGQAEPEVFEVRNLLRMEYGYREKPRYAFEFGELEPGRLMIGKVKGFHQVGVFVDIGLRDENGTPRDALVPQKAMEEASTALRDMFIKGGRVLVRIENLSERSRRIFLSPIDASSAMTLSGVAG